MAIDLAQLMAPTVDVDRMSLKSCSTALALIVAGCAPALAPPPPPVAQAPAKISAAPTEPTEPARPAPLPPPAFVVALQKEMADEGHKVQFSTEKRQFVAIMNFKEAKASSSPPSRQIRAWLARHGDALGYGVLGEPVLEAGGWATEAVPSGRMRFPNASECPGLLFEAAFGHVGHGEQTAFAPKLWVFACPSSQSAAHYLQHLHALIERMRQGTVKTATANDSIVAFLRSEGLAASSVKRDAKGVRVDLLTAKPLGSAPRLELVKAFAERLARADGLPPLDTVKLTPREVEGAPKDARPLAQRFAELELRLAKPPLDGVCIDPRVIVELHDDAATPGTVPGFWLSQVEVRCETEPAEGNKPPPDDGRVLPRAASGSLPFLAMSESVNFAWGYHHSGLVIDKRGDVYSFSGGEVFSGTSAHALAVLLRHGKTYQGTLPPADVDRLAALIPAVAQEPLVQRHVDVFDAPGGGCNVLRAGASLDALFSVPFETFGRTAGSRTGSASIRVKALLERAWKLGE